MTKHNKTSRRGGFSHYHSDEKLREYMALPAQKKLEWLEEVNRFLNDAMTPEAKAIAGKFRRGEI